ncbi:MAG: hypothetical protein O3A78_12085 [Nitrospinae bacterium]|jgi:hypothetical protein|nr:hypothetical protein [Nitrospinota bacterium]MDA1110525.1 hypothetical protein [Nitrospinota bacterium]
MFKKMSVLGGMVLILGLVIASPNAFADDVCVPVEEKRVKVEGYISKKFKKQEKAIFKEFAEMGHTRVALRPYPVGDTSKVVAIGRCVPAYIARHVLERTLKYTSGVDQIVNQAFISSHWFGVGVTMFDEPSQQNVTPEQVQQLLDPALSTDEFQALYQKFSIQDETVPYFGSQPKNAKKAQ